MIIKIENLCEQITLAAFADVSTIKCLLKE